MKPRRPRPVFMEQSECFNPDAEWARIVRTLSDRYGWTYGVFREAGVFRLEFHKPDRQYVCIIRPSLNGGRAGVSE